MSINTSDDLKNAQSLAETAQTLAIIALVLLTIAIVTKGGFAIANNLLSPENGWRDSVRNIGLILIGLLPAFLFFEAINHLRRALARFGRAEFFDHKTARHVADAGYYAIYAMIAIMVITPNLTQWVNREGGFDVRFEPEYIGMLAFAVFVSTVGRVLAVATDIKSENDAFV